MSVSKDLVHAGNDKQLCCDGLDVIQEVTRPVIEARLRLCSQCQSFDMGECKMMSGILAAEIRKEGATCPLSIWAILISVCLFV